MYLLPEVARWLFIRSVLPPFISHYEASSVESCERRDQLETQTHWSASPRPCRSFFGFEMGQVRTNVTGFSSPIRLDGPSLPAADSGQCENPVRAPSTRAALCPSNESLVYLPEGKRLPALPNDASYKRICKSLPSNSTTPGDQRRINGPRIVFGGWKAERGWMPILAG
ncbi:hypothetical protein KM043_012147 [Ampulex compressa]|nr:hypothetical protein KM043_012147 [Ampulex compressa]